METELFDCHTHSEFSSCAEDVSLQGYSKRALSTDIAFAVTDHSAHIFYPPGNRWGFWTDDAEALFEAGRPAARQRVLDYIRAARAAQRGRMLVGIELDVLPDGRKVFPEGLLGTLDVVLGAVHSMPTLRHQGRPEEIEAEFRFQVQALAGHGMQVLAHPWRLLLAADVPLSEELLCWTVATARDRGFALEINSHKQYPAEDLRMTRLAAEMGVPLAVGTDTHRWSEFGDFSYHVAILRQAGLPEERWDSHLWRPARPVGEAAAG
ncbi:MAG: PHP domain-containing protein [Armatimonadota bacterium]|nr:PHP domain-containing protein [Armatimonadota bacterium]